MTTDEFAKLPKQEQLTYWSWQSRDLSAFADEYYSVTKDPRDKLPGTSLKNTPQEIDTIMGFNISFIFSIEDEAERKKALLTVLRNGINSDAYPIWNHYLQDIPGGTLKIPLFSKNVVKRANVVAVGPLQTYAGQPSQTIESVDGQGRATCYYETYTDAQTGKETHTWIRD
ncbi:hypothetical protein [Arthrobacter sp. KNU40]|uniref:hypothetical protein n=1 Tax=Arthrobacter sp. KNU40 TaxID=3447965 RepID=UPI003F60C39D